jgi:hypothetical protein
VVYNFQTGKNGIKLLTEYKNITQKGLFRKAVLATLVSERKYDVIPQNGDRSRESNMRILVFRNKFCYQNAIMGHGNPDNNLESLCIYLPLLYVFSGPHTESNFLNHPFHEL